MSIEEHFIGTIRGGLLDEADAILQNNPALADATAEDGTSALMTALYYGHGDLARALAAHRTDLTLFEAAAIGNTHRLNELLNADPARVEEFSDDGFTALHLAVYLGQLDAADVLLKRGALTSLRSQNTMQVLPIHSAVANHDNAGAYALTRLLIESDADVNAVEAGGFTPLMAAAQNNNKAVVELLLQRGANKSATNSDGKTARDFAVAENYSEVAALL